MRAARIPKFAHTVFAITLFSLVILLRANSSYVVDRVLVEQLLDGRNTSQTTSNNGHPGH
jgi:hypothetical protein